jgi:hypothetical protein
MVENIFTVELLLAIIAALAGGQLIIIGFFARKYIREIDSIKSTVSQLKTEHCVFHKIETGIKQ